MNFLVIAATSKEISPFLHMLRDMPVLFPPEVEIDVLITGVGLVATTYSLARQVSIKRPGMVIQGGIGGCFDHSVPLGTVFAVKRDVIADQMAIEKNRIVTMFDLGYANPSHFPYKKGWLVNSNEQLQRTKLKKVTAVSVNQVTSSSKSRNLLFEKFDPLLESMEGAALHYVCLMEKINFLQIRAVSNYVGERNKKNWKFNEAIQNLNTELITLLKNKAFN